MLQDIKLLTVSGQNAEAELHRLRSEFSRTGLYPVIFGEANVFEAIKSIGEFHKAKTIQSIITHSLQINAVTWFHDELQDFEEDGGLELGEWPTEPLNISDSLQSHLNLMTKEVLPEVSIGLIPVQYPWEIFATLRWGSWNSCPHPEEHCAIHRYWYDKYGAEVVSVSEDVVECFVTNPPLTREDSFDLAKEQYLYDADIVEQGVGTISNLAAILMNSRYWNFWWD